jgi:hypothetical protein
MVKLEIFIPPSCLEQLRITLRSVGAGAFGNYDSVLNYSRVKGQGLWQTGDVILGKRNA